MITKVARYLLATLLIAGLVHIAAVLLIPNYAPHRAYDAVIQAAAPARLTLVAPNASPLPGLDPAFVYAVCPLTPHTGPVRLAGAMPDSYWSVSVVDDTGRIVASLTREDADTDTIDLTAGGTAATAGGAAATVPLASQAGFFLIRAMVEHRSARPDVEARLRALSCAAVKPG
jgi:uncharacterized membrane protein